MRTKSISKSGFKEVSSDKIDLVELNETFREKTTDELLIWGYERFGNELVIGTGFGSSGMVILHHCLELELAVNVFCLDTSLLFRQTYDLWRKTEKLFGIQIERVQPILTLQGQASQYKDELWKTDADQCCHLRKVLPLQKYLSNKKAWVTGLRKSQSSTRKDIKKIEWDELNKVFKINPLADWSADKIWEYIHSYKLPYNSLHDDGYPSIGCVPCTSPASDQNDERSGRWAGLDKIECGIHLGNRSK